MDVLRELREEELNYILEQLEKCLPHTIKDVHYIKTSIKTREVAKNLNEISDKVLPRFVMERESVKENEYAGYYTLSREDAMSLEFE